MEYCQVFLPLFLHFNILMSKWHIELKNKYVKMAIKRLKINCQSAIMQ